MKRTIAVAVLAAAALGLLASVALQSRSIPTQAHIAHHTVTTEALRIAEEFSTLTASLRSTWQSLQPPGDGARAIAAGVASSTERLREPVMQVPGNAAQRERLVNRFGSFSAAARAAGTLIDELLVELTAYADSVAYLRQQGPELVQHMRDIRLDREAADTFQLIAGTLELADPRAGEPGNDLRRLLATLSRDQRVDANMPGDARRLIDAVRTVLDTKPIIESRLGQLDETPVARTAEDVRVAASAAYTSAVAASDRARLMLAIYAVVLLLAVGFVAFRLQGSYRELNRANSDLEGLNQSLEQRVAERTRALEGTLADLKESQVQLVQAEKMSSLGQLVAGISHEINTPLLYLANNAVLIQERVALFHRFLKCCIAAFAIRPEDYENRAEYQKRFVGALRDLKVMLRREDVEGSVEEAQDLTTDSIEGLAELTEMAQSLKDFSRLDRAPVASFDVHAGLDKTLLIAKNIIKHKAEIRKFYGEVPEIQCSPSQINQIFLNILTNAAQAIESRGEIVITTKRHDDEHVSITIADTGCGISEENLAKIRDPFFTTKEVGSGTGLGLSIVDEIVRAHDGELLVESQVGKGSAFTVVLPINAEQRVPSKIAEPDGREDEHLAAEPDEHQAPTLAEAI